MIDESGAAIRVDFPLRGEWVAVTSPGRRPDPRTAMGVPCALRELEIEHPDGWERVHDVVRRRQDRIRYGPD